jgi:hypothetical protein
VRLLLVKLALVSATPDKSVFVRLTFCIDTRGPIINPFVAVDTVRATYPVGKVAVDTPTIPPPITVFVKFALVRVAFVRVDDVNVALVKFALVRVAFVMLADVNVALLKFALVRIAFVNVADDKNELDKFVFAIVALVRFADVIITLVTVAFVRFAFVKLDDVNVELESVAPDKSIPVIFILVMV